MSMHRGIIDGNLVTLCQLTKCSEILLDRCTERNVITREEKEVIEKKKTSYKRNRKFYKIIWLKEKAKFQNLLEIMKKASTAQSADVLKILEGINESGPSGQKHPRLQNPEEPEEKSVWFNVHDPITSFVGRENELKELHEMVTRNADKDTQVAIMSQLTSVSGLGGIGKTTLARQYAKQFASFFNNNIIWINAETTSSTEKSFRELADEIGVQNKIAINQNEKDVQISKITKDSYEYFSRRKCLFVFDNVEEYKTTVAPFIPKSYEPGKIRPYILMTSRKQRLVDDCRVLSLDILDIEDAKKFIKSKLQKCMGQIDDESVRKLANELQCLPLALQQAVSYIQNQVRLKSIFSGKDRNHIEEYLKLLEDSPKRALDHKYQDEVMDDYAYTVMRTWDVTLKAIQKEDYGSQAVEILEMLSYFPPEEIDIKEFNSAFSQKEVEHSCDILGQYSLINRVGEYIYIHRLVQQVIRVKNKEKHREEYLLGQCLSMVNTTSMFVVIRRNFSMYWEVWKHTLKYENLVIEFRSVLAKINVQCSEVKDLETLNSSLGILEKSVPKYEFISLYVIFINSVLFEDYGISFEDVPDCLTKNALTRLNALIELRQHDSIFEILDVVFEVDVLYSMTPVTKFVHDVVRVISNYFCEYPEDILPMNEDRAHYLVQFWLRLKQLGLCRKCFKLLVLNVCSKNVNNMVRGKDFHPVYDNFNLFTKYLLQLGTAADKNEREFVKQVLSLCRSLPLDANDLQRFEKVDILLCNILCLILLNDIVVHEILSCLCEISAQIRNNWVEHQEKKKEELYLYVPWDFERTMEDITFALNNVVIIGTSPLYSSEWTHYVEKFIKSLGVFEKIVEITHPIIGCFTSYPPELEPTILELDNCCKWFEDIDATISSIFME